MGVQVAVLTSTKRPRYSERKPPQKSGPQTKPASGPLHTLLPPPTALVTQMPA